MPNPYRMNVPAPRLSPPKDRKRESAEGMSDLMRMLGTAAPFLGTAAGTGIGALVGGPAGAMVGGGIGGGLGSAAGSALGAGADAQTRPFEEADAEREARRAMYLQMLGAARR